MTTDLEQIKENELYVKYVYDDKDRVVLRNVYEFNNTSRLGRVYSNYTKPKKLLYQDLYRYGNSQVPDKIKRIYQPIITPPTGTRVGNNITVSTNIICKSYVIASGFLFFEDSDVLMMHAQYPQYNVLSSPNAGNYGALERNKTFSQEQSTGFLSHTISMGYGATLYIKAYSMVETGILFSKTLTI